ncbi:MAG: TonB family protein [Candidatus Omnitrophica bacterium]|nr:TonB family protein [Candidatus Omnitrophota bacterium]
MRKIFWIAFLTIIMTASLIPCGNNYALDETASEDQEELKLYMGEVKTVPVSRPVRVAIGNPNIADVVNVTADEITLSPKSAGITTLVFWDNFGEQAYRVRVLTEDMQEIKRRIDKILSSLKFNGVYTQAADEENKVILLGNVKTAQDREKINTALGTLKDKIVDLLEIREEEAGVDIDVQVLELNKDATDTLGFTWPGSMTLTEVGSDGISAAGTTWTKLFHVVNETRAAFTVKLDALIQQGKARILSRPHLACQSGKEAQLLVGGEKPTFTTSVTEGGAASSTVEYKEYGIKLKIKPIVAEEKRIKLAVNVEVSEVGTVETIGSATAPTGKAYPLTKRSASTELYINDGETISIGGLIKQKTEEDLRKVPWLADVPVLGLFFRQKVDKVGGGQGERGNTELFITLTPKIIADKKEIKEAAQEIKTEIAAPAIVQEDMAAPEMAYARIIQKRILENLVYPRSAKEAGFQGRVKLSLQLSYQGQLLGATVKDTSGYQVLDDNALFTAKKISSYPPFPASVNQRELRIEVPISYRLE